MKKETNKILDLTRYVWKESWVDFNQNSEKVLKKIFKRPKVNMREF